MRNSVGVSLYNMKFDKPPLSFEAQADLLLSRGLIADKQILINRLTVVNYYRLSTYLYPFRTPDNKFQSGTTLDLIWRRYTFDRQLRLLVMDAIERFEVSVRTKLAYHFSHEYGPFAYFEPTYLPKLPISGFAQWIIEFSREIQRSKEPFIIHFDQKHGELHDLPPLWMAVEVMSFGKVLTMYRGIGSKLKQKISSYYGLSDEIFLSWFLTLNSVRNICAHHGRIFDRRFDYQPKIPRLQKYPEWHVPVKISRDRVFGILTILNYILQFDAPTSFWKVRLEKLFTDYADISKEVMGIPENWNESPLWKNK